eukprot:COSAG06_NODE_54778_length_293_cov_0.417526_1_plen_44_part_10
MPELSKLPLLRHMHRLGVLHVIWFNDGLHSLLFNMPTSTIVASI